MGRSSLISPNTLTTVFYHHNMMNKLLMLAFLVTLMAVLTLGSENQQDEEVALARQVRNADPVKKCRGKKGCRKNGGRKSKGGNRRRAGGRRKEEKDGQRKCRNKKCRNGKGGNRKSRKLIRQSSCTANATCLNKAMEYLNLMKGAVNNYIKQDARVRSANKTGGNKSGKKGLFAPTLRRIVKAGGGNKSDLQCSGSSNSSGAKQLKNLTDTLLKCETTINSSCNTANFPLPNITEVSACLTAIGTFKSMVDTCMKLNGTTACNCWVNSTFATHATTIRGCKLSDTSKSVIKQLGYCKGNFSLCKTFEDEGLKAISACSESSSDLTAKAAALTANSAGLTAAKTTASTLSSSRRVARATATTCAEIVTKITALLLLVDQNPSSTKISTAAAEVTSVTVTCTTTEKASLTTQVTSLTAAVATVAAELTTVQQDLETATGSTASAAAISAAANSTSTATAASSGRRNIVARHLMNRLNLN